MRPSERKKKQIEPEKKKIMAHMLNVQARERANTIAPLVIIIDVRSNLNLMMMAANF